MLDKKLKIRGKVEFCGTDRNNKTKRVCTMKLTNKQIDSIRDIIADAGQSFANIPLKEQEDGSVNLKAQTDFAVPIFEGGIESDDLDIDSIGKGSEVVLSIKLAQSTYRKKTNAVAYLSAINVIDLFERDDYNPFEDKELEEL